MFQFGVIFTWSEKQMPSSSLCNTSFRKNTKIANSEITEAFAVWKVSKYGVFVGSYFPVFSSNTGITCSKLTIETLEQSVKYVQS